MAIAWRLSPLKPSEAPLLDRLTAVWRVDPHRSPFCAPAYLAGMAEMAQADGARPLVALASADDGSPVAAWPLRVDPGGTIRMLHGEGADHCTCIAHPDVSADILAEGLAQVLKESGGTDLFLKNIPSWGLTHEAVQHAVAAAGWRGRITAATPCPVLSVPAGPGAADLLRRKVSGSSMKNLDNRLKKLPGFAFEAIEGSSAIEAWVEEFCDTHERRWNVTTTPSEYRFPDERRRLLGKLTGWARAGVLIRFSLSVNGERIALVVGLAAGDRLVYHHVTYSPSYAQYSPSNVLIRRIVLWMGERGFHALDFGSGGEAYKWRFADINEPLWRMAAAPRALSTMFARGVIEEQIRRSPRLQTLWDEWANRALRGAVASQLDRSRLRLRRLLTVDVHQPRSALIGRARTRLDRERSLFYKASADATLSDPEVMELKVLDVLAMLEEEVVIGPYARAQYLEAVRAGQRPFGLVEEGRVVQVCWLRRAQPDEVIPGREPAAAWVIADCVTARRARGRGLYPRVLRAIRATIPAGDACLIYTNDWNVASQRGIVKAGFLPVSIRERRKVGGEVETRWLPFV